MLVTDQILEQLFRAADRRLSLPSLYEVLDISHSDIHDAIDKLVVEGKVTTFDAGGTPYVEAPGSYNNEPVLSS